MSVYINNIESLYVTSPSLHDSFQKGMFSTQKSLKQFSKIALDQAHEQLNCKLKGDGGAIGLFDSEEALKRWVVAGPIVLLGEDHPLTFFIAFPL